MSRSFMRFLSCVTESSLRFSSSSISTMSRTDAPGTRAAPRVREVPPGGTQRTALQTSEKRCKQADLRLFTDPSENVLSRKPLPTRR